MDVRRTRRRESTCDCRVGPGGTSPQVMGAGEILLGSISTPPAVEDGATTSAVLVELPLWWDGLWFLGVICTCRGPRRLEGVIGRRLGVPVAAVEVTAVVEMVAAVEVVAAADVTTGTR